MQNRSLRQTRKPNGSGRCSNASPERCSWRRRRLEPIESRLNTGSGHFVSSRARDSHARPLARPRPLLSETTNLSRTSRSSGPCPDLGERVVGRVGDRVVEPSRARQPNLGRGGGGCGGGARSCSGRSWLSASTMRVGHAPSQPRPATSKLRQRPRFRFLITNPSAEADSAHRPLILQSSPPSYDTASPARSCAVDDPGRTSDPVASPRKLRARREPFHQARAPTHSVPERNDKAKGHRLVTGSAATTRATSTARLNVNQLDSAAHVEHVARKRGPSPRSACST